MLALVLHTAMQTLARLEASREARILDPYERVSADGRLRFQVEPSEREGRGPSTVFLLRDGHLVWFEELPFTPREAVVSRAGAVLACALDDQLWFRSTEHSPFRGLPPTYDSVPRAMVVEVLDLGWEDSALVRVRDAITDSSGRGRAERWWRFEFERGEWAETVLPERGIGTGFELVVVDPVAQVLLATEHGPDDSSWLRVLDEQGCSQGLQLLGGIGFDPVELAPSKIPACGNALQLESARLRELDRRLSFGLDLRDRMWLLRSETRESRCEWPHVHLASLGTSAGEIAPPPPASAPESLLRRLDGRWLNEVIACTRLPDGGSAIVDLPCARRGERFARLVLTDAGGQPVEEHVLPFHSATQVTARGDWIAVVPFGRPTVALVNRRTRERFETLTRTSDREARALLGEDAHELAVFDVEKGRIQRFRLDPR